MSKSRILALVLPLFAACHSAARNETRSAVMVHPPVADPLLPLEGTAYAAAANTHLPEVDPEEHPSLHNLFQLGDHILSGSEPHDEEAFQILHQKGIRTILSVDGKEPDEKLAAKYGMKYVHVPIQYKGITDEEMAKITKTFRELEGPFFVHCFHGKHRGPAAAEVGRLVLDGISRETALAEMRRCGTAESYEGLYTTIAYGTIPTESETSAMKWDFPAASPLDGIAGAMVLVSRADDHLKDLSKDGWQADPEHPDIDPVNEASKLASLFERSLAMEEVLLQPEDFRQWMADSKAQATALRDILRDLKTGSASMEQADKAYKAMSKTCTACHEVYRNN
jgi:protein tyrosine phosphatase (PTP) superfamily phosphohydrolase (DUF442 family)